MNTQTQSEDGIVLCQPKLLQCLNQQYVLQYHEIKNQSVNFFFLFFIFLFYSGCGCGCGCEKLLGIYAHILGEWIKCVCGYHPYHMSCSLHVFKGGDPSSFSRHFCPKQVTVWMNRYVTCKSIFMPLTFLSNLLLYIARAREKERDSWFFLL